MFIYSVNADNKCEWLCIYLCIKLYLSQDMDVFVFYCELTKPCVYCVACNGIFLICGKLWCF